MAITGLGNGYDEQNGFRRKLREKSGDEKENRTSDFYAADPRQKRRDT